jgi:hypothetical protein
MAVCGRVRSFAARGVVMVADDKVDTKAIEAFSDGALTVGQATQFSGLGRTTINELIAAKEVVSRRVSGRRLIARRSLVERMARGDGER